MHEESFQSMHHNHGDDNGSGGEGNNGGGYGMGGQNLDLMSVLNRGGGDGFGGGSMWGVILGFLLARGGFFGNREFAGEVGDRCVTGAQFLQKTLGDIQAAVPLTASQTQDVIQNAISQLALGMQQGFANVKDSVQAGQVLTLQSASATQAMVHDQAEKTRDLITSLNTQTLNRELAVAQSLLGEERSARRIREVEVNVTQTSTQNQLQAQAQAQQQAQLASVLAAITGLVNQVNRSSQDVINIGGTLAGLAQTAANTNVAR